jgi:DNA-binding beta-propeller fold protein YncE
MFFIWLSGHAAALAASEPFFLVPSGNAHTILQYSEEGEFVDAFVPFVNTSPLRNPRAVVVGPDGNIYVSSNRTNNPGNAVLRYDGASGNFMDVFARGPLDPFGLVFGTDGYLYATGTNSSNIVRFDGTSGEFIDVLASNSENPGTLSGPRGLVFGPDGSLYVTSPGFGTVVRYDISTGNFLGVFATIDSPDFFDRLDARDLVFGPDGNLYVTSFENSSVYRFNGSTGAFIDIFVPSGSGGLNGPVGLLFGPDGHLYVGSFNDGRVLRYHGVTGEFIDEFVSEGEGGLVTPRIFTVIEREIVAIDIRPGTEPNPISRSRRGVVPVAILSSANFDVRGVNPDSLRFARASVARTPGGKPLCHEEDTGGPAGVPDGFIDLVCQFKAAELVIEAGATSAALTGKLGSVIIRGEDSIVLVPK